MYIRKTLTKTLAQGEAYFTYRIVESVRAGKQIKQRTLLNLGKDFAIAPTQWPLLTARIEQLLQGSVPQQNGFEPDRLHQAECAVERRRGVSPCGVRGIAVAAALRPARPQGGQFKQGLFLQVLQKVSALTGFQATIGAPPVQSFTQRGGQLFTAQAGMARHTLADQLKLRRAQRLPAKSRQRVFHPGSYPGYRF